MASLAFMSNHLLPMPSISRPESNGILDARLRFLHQSAHLLATTAPSTSAHLMLERHTLAGYNGKSQSKASSKGYCLACGTIMITGQTSKTEIFDPNVVLSSLSKTRKKRRRKLLGLDKQVKTKCLICHRATTVPLPNVQKAGTETGTSLLSTGIVPPQNASASVQVKASSDMMPTTANNSSKKRAKVRQGGLQAMLERSKAMKSRSSGFDLDLMDFMKDS